MNQVDSESEALAREWLARLPFKSVLSNRPLSPRTIERYEQVIIGSPGRRKVQPSTPLLVYWAEVGEGRPIWAATLSNMLGWFRVDVRDGRGGVHAPSASEQNIRRSGAANFFTWMRNVKRLDVDEDVIDYRPPYEDRASTRRKQLDLSPLDDSAFRNIWYGLRTIDDRLWIGMSAFMTMRIGEIANLGPHEVDLTRQLATFKAKGGARRTVHYGELCERDWPMLPSIEGIYGEWLKVFETHVSRTQEDEDRDPELRWVCPFTQGECRPHRDDPSRVVWHASNRDMNRFDKSWQRALVGGGFPRRVFRPHQLRHFAAMNLWRSGASWDRIKREMGHDSSATTEAYLRYNADFDRERKRNERLRMNESD